MQLQWSKVNKYVLEFVGGRQNPFILSFIHSSIDSTHVYCFLYAKNNAGRGKTTENGLMELHSSGGDRH